MSKPLHTRPFCIESAKAGAPISLACGWPVSIIKYDMRDGKSPILGLYGDQDQIGRWTAAGVFLGGGHSSLNLVMIPLGYLDGKPVFVGDELIANNGQKMPLDIGFADDFDARFWRWPAPPKVYPVTSLSPSGAAEYFYASESPIRGGALIDTINIALRIFIDNLSPLPDDCALRAKLIEMGWTAPEGTNV